MAKKLRDEDLVLNIIINGNKSKKEMFELSRAINDTNREIAQLRKQQKEMAIGGVKETEAFEAVTAAIKKKEAAVILAEARLDQLRKGMKLTEMTLVDLRKEQLKLNQLLSISTPGTENYKNYEKQLVAVKDRIKELKQGVTETGFSFDGIADKFNQYIGVITAFSLTIAGIITGLKSINTTYAEFDDKVADVQKTTGLAKVDVRELNDEFKKIDTRTQQEDLLGLAQVAGKLGIEGKNDVLEFVKAADQISVALSEDLGGNVEDSINSIGKLVEVFKLKDTFGIEQSLIKVGSTINDLGAASSASEAYLVEFTKRVAGVAPAAKISIQNTLGLAATLDQLGQTAEVAGTTFNDVIPSMFKDTATFARIAGMDVSDFTTLLNTDANEAFIRTLEGLNGNNAGFGEMVTKLNELGVDGTRATNVLNVLASNTSLLRDQQVLANQSFKDGTSLAKEYGVKNQTAAANLDRAKKAVYNLTVELGEKLNPVLTGTTSGFVTMVKVLGAIVGFLIDNRKWITSVVAALVVYNATVAISNAFSAEGILLKKAEIALAKLKVFWDAAQTAGLHLMGAAYLLMRGQIAAAKEEMILFNAVTKANPWGLVLAAIAAVVAAFIMYSGQLTATQKAQQALLDVEGEARKSIVSQKLELEKLLTIARDKIKTDGERLAAIQKLNEISPEYLGFLNLENINTQKATDATNTYIDSLLKVARVKAAEAKLVDLERKKIDLATKPMETSMWQKTGAAILSAWGGTAAAVNFESASMATNYAEATQDIKAEEKALRDYLEKNQSKPKTKVKDPTTGGSVSSLTGDEIKARSKYLLESKSQLEQEKAAHEARLKETGLFGKARKDMTAGDLETLASLNKLYQEKVADINNKASKKAMSSLDKDHQKALELMKQQEEYRLEVINSQKSDVEQENNAHLARLQKAGIDEKNVAKGQQEAYEALKKMHQANLDKIDSQAITKHLDKIQKKFDTELRALKIKNNEELAGITSIEQAKALLKDRLSTEELTKLNTLEKAKKALKQKYVEDEAILTKEQLDRVAVMLQQALDTGEFENLELSDKILSAEQLEALSERLGVAKEKIAEIMAAAKDKGDTDKNVDSGFSFEKSGGKTDILGMNPEDWDLFFTHIETGKVGLSDMVAIVGALTSAYQLYNNFMLSAEKKQLQAYEKATNDKKATLQRQLDSGQISQEAYNKKIADLDADLDKKKLDIEVKQAKRERIMALMNIAQSTAQAIIGIWAQVPKFDFGISAGILTGIVAGIGAAQAAAVLAAPLPGKEEGGFLETTRSQDGKKFNAQYSPNKRGYIPQTSVLVSENGMEFVASAEAVNNPSVKQMLDIIDTAQKNGTINTLNMESLFDTSYPKYRIPGRASGGYVNNEVTNTDPTPVVDPRLYELLTQLYNINKKLTKQLDSPIPAEVSLLGKSGFIAKMDELKTTEENANL